MRNKNQNVKHQKVKVDSQLQDIWMKHIEVQEMLLKLNSTPVPILPDSVKVIGNKLHVRYNEIDQTEAFLDEIATAFSIDRTDINDTEGYFLCPRDCSVSKDTISNLQLSSNRHYITLSSDPIIDGVIKVKSSPLSKLEKFLFAEHCHCEFDKKGRLRLPVNDMRKLLLIKEQADQIFTLPDNANAIFTIQANPIFFMKKKCPDVDFKHELKFAKTLSGKSVLTDYIICNGGYLPSNILAQFNSDWGAKLLYYEYIFKVEETALSKYDRETSPYVLPKLKDGAFIFHIEYKDKRKENGELEYDNNSVLNAYEEENLDFDYKYTRLNRFFYDYFGKENVSFQCRFVYAYDRAKFYEDFLPKADVSDFMTQVETTLVPHDVAVGMVNSTIGVDFEWRNKNLQDVMIDIANVCPFIDMNYYHEEHRCNVEFNLNDTDLVGIQDSFKAQFPSLKTFIDAKAGSLRFVQEYTTDEQRHRIENALNDELSYLDEAIYDSELFHNPDGTKRYLCICDVKASSGSKELRLKDLRGKDFEVDGLQFGSLWKMNYPDLVFILSEDNFDSAVDLFKTNPPYFVTPDLSGDLEKISRLKTAFDRITSGNNLKNPNLPNFIFDASKASSKEEVDYMINPASEMYQDMSNNLLNKNINGPQMKAIIKTLLAPDLALIQGPPGTGKSTAIAEIIWQHIRKNPNERILLTSETHLAVDNAIDRVVNDHHNLVKPIRFGDDDNLESEGRQFSLGSLMYWRDNGNLDNITVDDEEDDTIPDKVILQNWLENIDRRVDDNSLGEVNARKWHHILMDPDAQMRSLVYDAYLHHCNVVGATCSSIGMTNTKGKPTNFFKQYCTIFGSVTTGVNEHTGNKYINYKSNDGISFSTVIQDESSKATPAELSLPLIYGKKNIVIGDHRQLPPMLDKEEFIQSLDYLIEQSANVIEIHNLKRLKNFVVKHFNEMEISHFERLFKAIPSQLKGEFTLQYRMHPDINDVIKQFYVQDGGLECGLTTPIDLGVNDPDLTNPASRYHGIDVPGLITPDSHVIWIDTNTPELQDGTSRINPGEVDAIRYVLKQLSQSESFKNFQKYWEKVEDQQIGIISFYSKQRKLIRSLRSEFKDIPMRIDVVDRFQGMERNIVIVSMVRSDRIASAIDQKPDNNLYGELGFPEQNDLGFAQSPNRLNVALSRARRLLVIVGNSSLFRRKEIYDNVYRTIAKNPNNIIKFDLNGLE